MLQISIKYDWYFAFFQREQSHLVSSDEQRSSISIVVVEYVIAPIVVSSSRGISTCVSCAVTVGVIMSACRCRRRGGCGGIGHVTYEVYVVVHVSHHLVVVIQLLCVGLKNTNNMKKFRFPFRAIMERMEQNQTTNRKKKIKFEREKHHGLSLKIITTFTDS